MHTHVTPTTLTEAHRLSVLRGLNILDTAPDPEFDDLVDLAAHFFAAKYALVSLVDEDRQFYKARHAFAAKQSPREGAFCAHAIMQDDVFVVPNTTQDERFHDKASVTGPPHIRFYAGAPILIDGAAIGTFCILDDEPRPEFDDKDCYHLTKFARLARTCALYLKENPTYG